MAGYKYRGNHTGLDSFDAAAIPRKRLRDPKPPRQIRPCGTWGAYNRHKAHKEEACDKCKAAMRVYRREQYHKQQAAKKEQS